MARPSSSGGRKQEESSSCRLPLQCFDNFRLTIAKVIFLEGDETGSLLCFSGGWGERKTTLLFFLIRKKQNSFFLNQISPFLVFHPAKQQNFQHCSWEKIP